MFVSDTLDKADDETDGNGEYLISVSSDTRKARLEVKKAGYMTRIESVFLDDSDVTIDIDLEPK